MLVCKQRWDSPKGVGLAGEPGFNPQFKSEARSRLEASWAAKPNCDLDAEAHSKISRRKRGSAGKPDFNPQREGEGSPGNDSPKEWAGQGGQPATSGEPAFNFENIFADYLANCPLKLLAFILWCVKKLERLRFFLKRQSRFWLIALVAGRQHSPRQRICQRSGQAKKPKDLASKPTWPSFHFDPRLISEENLR